MSAGAEVYSRAVEAVTEACRAAQRAAVTEAADLAELLVGLVASAAANLGDPYALTAGRPGSWESNLVGRIAAAALGSDPAILRSHRTAPVVVRVCVAEAANEAGVAHLDDMVDQLVDAVPVDADPSAETELEARVEATRAAYVAAFTQWADRFRAGVQAQAAAWPELRVPVVVEVDTDPGAPWWEPGYGRRIDEYGRDLLAAELARAGYAAAGDLVVAIGAGENR